MWAAVARPAAGAVTLTALAPGPCRVSVAVGGAGRQPTGSSVTVAVRSRGAAVFPSGRPRTADRLEDGTGAPFLIKGETAWLALVNLDESEQEAYLADRGARGFNLVEVMLLNHDYTEAPNPVRRRTLPEPARRAALPSPRGTSRRPDDAYFRRARAFVDRAARHGVAVLLAPVYLGFDGGKEGWWAETLREGNTAEVLARSSGGTWGRSSRTPATFSGWPGETSRPPPGSEGERRHWAVLQGIRSRRRPRSPGTGHWNYEHQGGISTDQVLFAPAMALDGVYQYAHVWKAVLRAAGVVPAAPGVPAGEHLRHEHRRETPASATQPFRKAWWWSMLSGGSGVLWGNLFLWSARRAAGQLPGELRRQR